MKTAKDFIHQYPEGFCDPDNYLFKSNKGLNEQIVREISAKKQEPEWMLELRLQGLKNFEERPMQKWGPDLTELDTNDIYYYVKPVESQGKTWADVPEAIKKTFDRLGVPEAEKQHLAGLGAQYESEVVYHNLKKEWQDLGVVFLDTESGAQTIS